MASLCKGFAIWGRQSFKPHSIAGRATPEGYAAPPLFCTFCLLLVIYACLTRMKGGSF